jgi:hypothetical protein
MDTFKILRPTEFKLVIQVDFFIETVLLTSPLIFFGAMCMKATADSLSNLPDRLFDVIGGAVLGAISFWGVYLFLKSSSLRQRFIFDNQLEKLTIIRYGISGKKTIEFDLGQIDSISLVEAYDSCKRYTSRMLVENERVINDPDNCYTVSLIMRDKSVIMLGSVFSNQRKNRMIQLILRIEDFIGLSEDIGNSLKSSVSDFWNIGEI